MHKVFPRNTRISRRLVFKLMVTKVACTSIVHVLSEQLYGTNSLVILLICLIYTRLRRKLKE